MMSFFTNAQDVTIYKAILRPFRTMAAPELDIWIKFIVYHGLDKHRQQRLPELLAPNL